jgi:hypothetical protein
MRARAGDTLMVKERRAGEGDREALIVEVRSEYGRPPYAVRWPDGTQNAFFFPAPGDTLTERARRRIPPDAPYRAERSVRCSLPTCNDPLPSSLTGRA